MTNLVFDIYDYRRVVAHAHLATRWSSSHSGPKTSPSMILVGDTGVYLMSNAVPRDTEGMEGSTCFTAYAKGMNPHVDVDTYYDAKVSAYGGDDGTDYIDCGDLQHVDDRIAAGATSIVITITADELILRV